MSSDIDDSARIKDVVDAFYRDALELRSRLLRDKPQLDQETYTQEIWKILVPYFNDMTSYLSSRIPEPIYSEIHSRMMQVLYSVSSMAVQRK
jgi:hypothetical protein